MLVSKMEMKPKSACFLPAIEGRLVTSPRPGLSFSLADASAAGFIRCVPGPQLAVVSCGDRGPFGLEISMCLWAQEHVNMLSCPLACLCSKNTGPSPCQGGPCCSLYWRTQAGGEGQWSLCCGWWLNTLWDVYAAQHLTHGFVMVQKLQLWVDICGQMVALMGTFM